MTTSFEHQADPLKRARLRWRARRGLLENDLIITRFLDQHELQLSDEDVAVLSELFELPDNELLDLILARREPEGGLDAPAVHRVLGMLRAA
ncbi:succinate dehydrogenase assembly factor 2 [Derxia gummosa]|uniref:FAD assembly factor SdhE n=1 Tax=Derxia gummosa DSM 723 TaxID=1121388 RepID=A0A8B6X719_9BURK|nr:succinate dehydrogenase assembly factor 2 [Derxia gummosa]